jgi:exonuclease III
LTDESSVDKENSIWRRKVQNQMFMDSIKFYWKFNWIYGWFDYKKIHFEVNLGFNWKKLKFWGQIIIFES